MADRKTMIKNPEFYKRLVMPGVYRIRVSGRLDPSWSDRLEDMSISFVHGETPEPVSELTGRLPDQASLMGILQQLYDRGIALISVDCIGYGNDKDTRKQKKEV